MSTSCAACANSYRLERRYVSDFKASKIGCVRRQFKSCKCRACVFLRLLLKSFALRARAAKS